RHEQSMEEFSINPLSDVIRCSLDESIS
ncbi:MAG: hypothetical protein ACI90R_001892, partial [Alteromonas macleodii]